MKEVLQMKDLKLVANECMSMLDNVGIEYGNIKNWEINTRAIKRWGQCKKRDGGFIISISNKLLDDSVDNKALETTVLHELLHTVNGCFNHGNKWQNMANKINNRYGYNIKTTTSHEEKGIEREPYKYMVKCQSCGREVGRYKMSSIIQNPQNWKCGCCGGKFERIL